jgi:hypothetical protein
MFAEIITPSFLEDETVSEEEIKGQGRPRLKERLYYWGERCMAFLQVLQYLIFSSAL